MEFRGLLCFLVFITGILYSSALPPPTNPNPCCDGPKSPIAPLLPIGQGAPVLDAPADFDFGGPPLPPPHFLKMKPPPLPPFVGTDFSARSPPSGSGVAINFGPLPRNGGPPRGTGNEMKRWPSRDTRYNVMGGRKSVQLGQSGKMSRVLLGGVSGGSMIRGRGFPPRGAGGRNALNKKRIDDKEKLSDMSVGLSEKPRMDPPICMNGLGPGCGVAISNSGAGPESGFPRVSFANIDSSSDGHSHASSIESVPISSMMQTDSNAGGNGPGLGGDLNAVGSAGDTLGSSVKIRQISSPAGGLGTDAIGDTIRGADNTVNGVDFSAMPLGSGTRGSSIDILGGEPGISAPNADLAVSNMDSKIPGQGIHGPGLDTGTSSMVVTKSGSTMADKSHSSVASPQGGVSSSPSEYKFAIGGTSIDGKIGSAATSGISTNERGFQTTVHGNSVSPVVPLSGSGIIGIRTETEVKIPEIELSQTRPETELPQQRQETEMPQQRQEVELSMKKPEREIPQKIETEVSQGAEVTYSIAGVPAGGPGDQTFDPNNVEYTEQVQQYTPDASVNSAQGPQNTLGTSSNTVPVQQNTPDLGVYSVLGQQSTLDVSPYTVSAQQNTPDISISGSGPNVNIKIEKENEVKLNIGQGPSPCVCPTIPSTSSPEVIKDVNVATIADKNFLIAKVPTAKVGGNVFSPNVEIPNLVIEPLTINNISPTPSSNSFGMSEISLDTTGSSSDVLVVAALPGQVGSSGKINVKVGVDPKSGSLVIETTPSPSPYANDISVAGATVDIGAAGSIGPEFSGQSIGMGATSPSGDGLGAVSSGTTILSATSSTGGSASISGGSVGDISSGSSRVDSDESGSGSVSGFDAFIAKMRKTSDSLSTVDMNTNGTASSVQAGIQSPLIDASTASVSVNDMSGIAHDGGGMLIGCVNGLGPDCSVSTSVDSSGPLHVGNNSGLINSGSSTTDILSGAVSDCINGNGPGCGGSKSAKIKLNDEDEKSKLSINCLNVSDPACIVSSSSVGFGETSAPAGLSSESLGSSSGISPTVIIVGTTKSNVVKPSSSSSGGIPNDSNGGTVSGFDAFIAQIRKGDDTKTVSMTDLIQDSVQVDTNGLLSPIDVSNPSGSATADSVDASSGIIADIAGGIDGNSLDVSANVALSGFDAFIAKMKKTSNTGPVGSAETTVDTSNILTGKGTGTVLVTTSESPVSTSGSLSGGPVLGPTPGISSAAAVTADKTGPLNKVAVSVGGMGNIIDIKTSNYTKKAEEDTDDSKKKTLMLDGSVSASAITSVGSDVSPDNSSYNLANSVLGEVILGTSKIGTDGGSTGCLNGIGPDCGGLLKSKDTYMDSAATNAGEIYSVADSATSLSSNLAVPSGCVNGKEPGCVDLSLSGGDSKDFTSSVGEILSSGPESVGSLSSVNVTLGCVNGVGTDCNIISTDSSASTLVKIKKEEDSDGSGGSSGLICINGIGPGCKVSTLSGGGLQTALPRMGTGQKIPGDSSVRVEFAIDKSSSTAADLNLLSAVDALTSGSQTDVLDLGAPDVTVPLSNIPESNGALTKDSATAQKSPDIPTTKISVEGSISPDISVTKELVTGQILPQIIDTNLSPADSGVKKEIEIDITVNGGTPDTGIGSTSAAIASAASAVGLSKSSGTTKSQGTSTGATNVTTTPSITTPKPKVKKLNLAALCLLYLGAFIDGVGYAPYPGNCQKLVQCFFYHGKLKALDRECPLGMFWDQSLLLCRIPGDVPCFDDRCLVHGTLRYKRSGGCGCYFKCIEGISVPASCPRGYKYDDDEECKRVSGIIDDVCDDDCDTPGDLDSLTSASCPSMPDPENKFGYIDREFGGLRFRGCPDGTMYSTRLCRCQGNLHKPVNGFRKQCLPEFKMNFDDGFRDISDGGLSFEHNNIFRSNNACKFNGDGQIFIWGFTSRYLGKTFAIKLKVKPFRGSGRRRPQVIVSNCGSHGEPSIEISIYKGRMRFKAKTTGSNHVVTASELYNEDEWNEVTYYYNGKHFGGSCGRNSFKKVTGGNLEPRDNPLSIGSCGGSGFRGEIDDLEIFTACVPKDV